MGHQVQRKDSNGNLLYLDQNGNETTVNTGKPSMEMVYDGANDYRSDEFGEKAGRTNENGEPLYIDADGNETTEKYDADGNAHARSYKGYEPGANLNVGANSDRDNAAAIGSSRPGYSPMDATTAYIGKHTVVTSAGDIIVKAYDNVVADHVTISAGVGFTGAGVAVGIAVTIIYGNVRAYVEDGSVLSAEGDVKVTARSGSTPATAATGQNDLIQDNVDKDGDTFKFMDITIRTVSFTVGAGLAGIAVAVGATSLISFTEAYLAGSVTKADNVNVEAKSEYPYVISGALTISGGAAGVSASVGIVTISGKTFAGITGNAQLNEVGNVDVLAEADAGAISLNGAGAIGGLAVNGLISVVVNRAVVESMIGQGVSIEASGNVKVASRVETAADALLVSVGLGGFSVGIGVAVVVLDADILTYAGVTPGDTVSAGAVGNSVGTIKANKLQIVSDVNSAASATIASISGGLAAVNGNVLLVFNSVDSKTGISRINVETTGDIDVDANMDSSSRSFILSAAVGNISVGVTVSYVSLKSANLAFIDTEGVSIKSINGSIDVFAGRESESGKNIATAETEAVAGAAGGIAVNLNAAVADNNAKNNAVVSGSGSLSARYAVNVAANGEATAKAKVTGVTVSVVSVAGSFAVSLLRSEQLAELKEANVSAGGLSVISNLNKNIDEVSEAELETGTGGLITVTANVAVAYGRSRSVANVMPQSLTVTGGNVKVGSYGNANVLSKTSNLDVSVASAAMMVNVAYSQSVFEAILELPLGSVVTAGSVVVETKYRANATADLTPSLGGVKVNLASIGANVVVSNADSSARAEVKGRGSINADTLRILADGTAVSTALTKAPNLSANVVSIAANVVVAHLDAQNRAILAGCSVTGAEVSIDAKLNDGDNEGAYAKLGPSIPEALLISASTAAR